MEITESIITEKNEIFSPFETYFGGLSMGVLDIETSGLSPESSQVILVGILSARREDGALIMKQFFAEDPGEEEALLKAVDRDYQNLDFLVTYNGRAFDLPFWKGEEGVWVSPRHQIYTTWTCTKSSAIFPILESSPLI